MGGHFGEGVGDAPWKHLGPPVPLPVLRHERRAGAASGVAGVPRLQGGCSWYSVVIRARASAACTVVGPPAPPFDT